MGASHVSSLTAYVGLGLFSDVRPHVRLSGVSLGRGSHRRAVLLHVHALGGLVGLGRVRGCAEWPCHRGHDLHLDERFSPDVDGRPPAPAVGCGIRRLKFPQARNFSPWTALAPTACIMEKQDGSSKEEKASVSRLRMGQIWPAHIWRCNRHGFDACRQPQAPCGRTPRFRAGDSMGPSARHAWLGRR